MVSLHSIQKGQVQYHRSLLIRVFIDTLIRLIYTFTVAQNRRFVRGRRRATRHTIVPPRAHRTMHHTSSPCTRGRVYDCLEKETTFRASDICVQRIYRKIVSKFPNRLNKTRNHRHGRNPLLIPSPPSPTCCTRNLNLQSRRWLKASTRTLWSLWSAVATIATSCPDLSLTNLRPSRRHDNPP